VSTGRLGSSFEGGWPSSATADNAGIGALDVAGAGRPHAATAAHNKVTVWMPCLITLECHLFTADNRGELPRTFARLLVARYRIVTAMSRADTPHRIQAQRRYEARSSERFDRVAYTMALLRLLKPPMTVAVYAGNQYLHVERSGQRTPREPWAILGVPPHATRESIAAAVAELSGLQREPFVLDLLCAGTVEAAD
jgi:hypothetical protein